MKKTFAILLVVVMTVGLLAACSGDKLLIGKEFAPVGA